MPKAPKIAMETCHGTSGSQTKLLVAGTIVHKAPKPQQGRNES